MHRYRQHRFPFAGEFVALEKKLGGGRGGHVRGFLTCVREHEYRECPQCSARAPSEPEPFSPVLREFGGEPLRNIEARSLGLIDAPGCLDRYKIIGLGSTRPIGQAAIGRRPVSNSRSGLVDDMFIRGSSRLRFGEDTPEAQPSKCVAKQTGRLLLEATMRVVTAETAVP